MRCPTCHADNQEGSYACHSCLRPLALVEGGVVPEAFSAGQAKSSVARFVRQPSEWTLPLQATVAAYMVLSAVVSVLALALGREQFTQAFVLSATARGTTLSVDQLTSTAGISYNGVLVVTAFVAALKVLLAAGGFMRWSWIYLTDMVLLVLSALGTLGTLLLVPSLGAGATLLGQATVTVIIDLAGISLLAWMAVAVNRYGIWACRKIPLGS